LHEPSNNSEKTVIGQIKCSQLRAEWAAGV
jgi:hypothetical protein